MKKLSKKLILKETQLRNPMNLGLIREYAPQHCFKSGALLFKVNFDLFLNHCKHAFFGRMESRKNKMK